MTLDISKYPNLALADKPEDLRLLPKETLPQLCDELRTYLLNSVSQSSGHLASGLGTVELTVAHGTITLTRSADGKDASFSEGGGL